METVNLLNDYFPLFFKLIAELLKETVIRFDKVPFRQCGNLGFLRFGTQPVSVICRFAIFKTNFLALKLLQIFKYIFCRRDKTKKFASKNLLVSALLT
jgi:hypothetical protein